MLRLARKLLRIIFGSNYEGIYLYLRPRFPPYGVVSDRERPFALPCSVLKKSLSYLPPQALYWIYNPIHRQQAD